MDKHSVWTDADDDKSIAPMKTFLSVANYDKPPPPFYHLTQQTELFGRYSYRDYHKIITEIFCQMFQQLQFQKHAQKALV